VRENDLARKTFMIKKRYAVFTARKLSCNRNSLKEKYPTRETACKKGILQEQIILKDKFLARYVVNILLKKYPAIEISCTRNFLQENC